LSRNCSIRNELAKELSENTVSHTLSSSSVNIWLNTINLVINGNVSDFSVGSVMGSGFLILNISWALKSFIEAVLLILK